jgi:hypothetical protein
LVALIRIGTWNLDNNWNSRHGNLLNGQKCDVWLLTEVNPKAENPKGMIAGFHCHLSLGVLECGQHSAVLTRKALAPLADPHPASAAAIVDGITYWSTTLPWANATESFWVGACQGEKTEAAIQSLLKGSPKSDLVWGGDWNHALIGPQYGASAAGRSHLLAAIQTLRLQVPTAGLLARLAPRSRRIAPKPGLLSRGTYSIDHIAVPSTWITKSEARVMLATALSDHDAYVIEVEIPTA